MSANATTFFFPTRQMFSLRQQGSIVEAWNNKTLLEDKDDCLEFSDDTI